MTVNTTSCQFHLLHQTKTSKPGQKCKPLVFNEYTLDPKLCPLSMLKEYIQKTKPLRNSAKKLLISFMQPHKAVPRDTISRWTKDVLKPSIIDITTFTAHSTRAATASKANAKDVPPYPVQGLNFCWYFHVHVTVRFVGRNVALLLTVGVDAFAPVLSFNNCINTGQQALIGIPIVIC